MASTSEISPLDVAADYSVSSSRPEHSDPLPLDNQASSDSSDHPLKLLAGGIFTETAGTSTSIEPVKASKKKSRSKSKSSKKVLVEDSGDFNGLDQYPAESTSADAIDAFGQLLADLEQNVETVSSSAVDAITSQRDMAIDEIESSRNEVLAEVARSRAVAAGEAEDIRNSLLGETEKIKQLIAEQTQKAEQAIQAVASEACNTEGKITMQLLCRQEVEPLLEEAMARMNSRADETIKLVETRIGQSSELVADHYGALTGFDGRLKTVEQHMSKAGAAVAASAEERVVHLERQVAQLTDLLHRLAVHLNLRV